MVLDITYSMFPRLIWPSLRDHLKKKQITVLTGMRRTGKTTLIRGLLKEANTDNSLYLDFQRLPDRELFYEKNIDVLLESLSQRGLDIKKPLIIALDEFQLAPEAASVVKVLYDHYHVKFLITGSSSYYLKNLFSESLSGRKKIFELFPLNFSEVLTFQGVSHLEKHLIKDRFSLPEYERLKAHYESFIRFGGFPEVVLAKTAAEKKDLLLDIISSYINIDIKSVMDFRHHKALYELIKLLAGRVGSKADMVKLGITLGLSRHTVASYLEALEMTYLITRIPVHSTNADRQIVKAKKIYFNDTGLLNVLAELSSGSQFENAVFTQLRHLGNLSYFSLKTGKEIDFIVNKKEAYEVKERPTGQDLKSLRHLCKLAKVKKCALIGRSPVPGFSNFLWGGEIR